MKGKLIVFEGGEGAGKSSQMGAIADWLRREKLGKESKLVTTMEPGGTMVGHGIRQILLDGAQYEGAITPMTELMLYMADRAAHVDAWLRPGIEAGFIILCDRYTYSTLAYQGHGRGLDLIMIHRLGNIATGCLHADLTIWLDVDPAIGLARAKTRKAGSDRIEQEELEFHQRVHRGFSRYHASMKRVDANQTFDKVTEDIKAILNQFFIPDECSADGKK